MNSARSPRLAAVVVTFNRLDQIKQTVARLLGEKCERIYVIDNGSTDGTREWLGQVNDDRVRVTYSATNLGGAGGFEAGLRKAVAEDDPDWIVIMDDDARPQAGCFAAFLNEDYSCWDAVSGAVYLRDGRICEMNRPTINPFWSLPTFARTTLRTLTGQSRAGFHIPDEAYENTAMAIDATSFVGLFLPRDTIRKAGYPNGSLFIYGDDVMYTLSLRKAGMNIGFVPDLRFDHDYNSANNGEIGTFDPLWKAYYTTRNGLIVYRFAAGILFWPILLPVLTKWISQGRHYGNGRRAYYRLVWQGIKDGLVGRCSRPHSEVTSLAADRISEASIAAE